MRRCAIKLTKSIVIQNHNHLYYNRRKSIRCANDAEFCSASSGPRNRYCIETDRHTERAGARLESCCSCTGLGISQSAGTCSARSNFTAPISREALNRIWRRHGGPPTVDRAASPPGTRRCGCVPNRRPQIMTWYSRPARSVGRSVESNGQILFRRVSTYPTSSGPETVAMVVALLAAQCRPVVIWFLITLSLVADTLLPRQHRTPCILTTPSPSHKSQQHLL